MDSMLHERWPNIMQFSPRDEPAPSDDVSIVPALKKSLVEGVARMLWGIHQTLTDSPEFIPYEDMPKRGLGMEQSHANFVARGAVRSIDPQWIEDAELRALQAASQALYGREFHRLKSDDKSTRAQKQSLVLHLSLECCAAYRTAIEGLSSPLHPEERRNLLMSVTGEAS